MNTYLSHSSSYCPVNKCVHLASQLLEKSLPRETKLKALDDLCNSLSELRQESRYLDIEKLQRIFVDVSSVLTQRQPGADYKKKLCEACLSTAILMPGEFEWVVEHFIIKFKMRNNDDRTTPIKILSDLTKYFFENCKIGNSKGVSMVMSIVSLCLAENTSENGFTPLLDLGILISKYDPETFYKDFEVFVDYIVGWMVVSNSAATIEKCRITLTDLRLYWARDLVYGRCLITALVSDLVYFDFSSISEGFSEKVEESLRNARTIVLAISTILKIQLDLGDNHSEIIEAMHEILNTLRSKMLFLRNYPENGVVSFLSSFGDIFTAFAHFHPLNIQVESILVDLRNLILSLIEGFINHPSSLVLLLNALAEVQNMSSLPSEVTLPIIDVFFQADGIFENIKYVHSVTLSHTVSSVIAASFSPTSMKNLQRAYSLATYHLKKDIDVLSTYSRNVYHPLYEVRAAEIRLITLINSFAKVAVLKNNLILMMGMSPPLLEMLLTEIPLSEQWLIDNHPTLIAVVLKIIYQHVASHDYFLASSDWLQSAPNSIMSESLTKKYLQLQIDQLNQFLRLNIKWKAINNILFDWLHGLFESVSNETFNTWMTTRSEICELRVLLRKKMIEGCVDEKQKLLALCERFGSFEAVDDGEAADVSFAVVQKMREMDIQEGIKLWSRIDSKNYIRCALSSKGWDKWEMQQIRPLSNSIGADDFTFLIDFLLKRTMCSYQKNPQADDNWLTDSVVQLFGKTIGEIKQSGASGNTFNEKWRWVVTQLAFFCVDNKMKTPLGKPADTFGHLYVEIQKLAKEALGVGEKKNVPSNERYPSKKSAKDEEDDEDYGNTRNLTSAEEWLRVRCLLEFVEVLDKIMFVAHSGSLYPMANISQHARQFFVTNIVSCQEMLNRMYSSAMVVAYHNGYYAQVIRFGSSVLADLEKRQKKVDFDAEEKTQECTAVTPPPNAYAVLSWMARAMAELGSEQAAHGLKDWAKRIYRVDMSFLDGIADMASGRYESALSRLCSSLCNDNLPDSCKTIIRHMILDNLRILRQPVLFDRQNCPIQPNMWGEADVSGNSAPDGFDIDAFDRVRKLCSFSILDKVAPVAVSWDINHMIEHNELKLMQTLRRVDVQDLRKEVSKTGQLVLTHDTGLRLSSNISSLDRIFSAVLCKMSKTKSAINEISPQFLFTEPSLSDLGARFALSLKYIFWAERLAGPTMLSSDIYCEAARLSRKSGNSFLAQTLFQKCAQAAHSDECFLKSTLQRVKMVWPTVVRDNKKHEWLCLFSAVSEELQMLRVICNNIMTKPEVLTRHNDLIARASLHLARWLQEEPSIASAIPYADYAYAAIRSEIESVYCRQFKEPEEMMVYGLLGLAARRAPRMAKAHLRLADWAFAAANEKLFVGRDVLNKITSELGIEPATFDSLYNLCNTCTTLNQFENEMRNIMGSNTEALRCLLHPSSPFMILFEKQCEKRVNFLPFAVSEYFSYISALGSTGEMVANTKSIKTVSVTLRILSLLVKHSNILQTNIDVSLALTNELLWKDILPQLFARLSHPLEEVRNTIVSLITRIARSSPHSVVFQILTGASSTMVVEESDDAIGAEKDEDDTATKDRSLMCNCCRQLELYMEQLFPTLVKDTREFISELQKINLLYEERWIFVLSNLDHEMEKRLEQIKAESQRTMLSSHLDDKTKAEIVVEKTRLITTSVYRILRDLYERTCVQQPTTLNEKAFVDTYGEQLKVAFEHSKTNKKSPEKAWAPFKQILTVLLQKNARRGGQILQMDNISTYLANLHKSSIPIPGQENKNYSSVITISKLRPTALVLSTKTKPKKLTFVGSDGKEQTFLLKGQEDLHLDERIMQLLHICNLMLNNSTKRSWPPYTARHYAVTPLGTRSGLIQWVGGAIPMFQLYRKWQTRQAHLKADNKQGSGKAVELDRPTDLFHKTLRRGFAKHNVDPAIAADRSKWPHAVLVEVLGSLLKETPRDILSRELWLKAGGGDTWWRVVSRLARSTAVMSMIGAILGLGDRHLDNLLVNLDTGDIVHIDYNICFDKGKHLRVPETVPFRMTQNMVTAMGPTQMEGTFRLSCTHVLTTLRKQREIFLTILDAFVYDPLVDWAATDHLTSSSAAVGVAVTLAVYGTDLRVAGAKPVAREMFSVRVKELSVPWVANCNELTNTLNTVKNVLKKQMNSPKHTVWGSSELLEQERVEAGRRLKSAITQHHQMMKDFRPLLRALATCDERFARYMKVYRAVFSEPLVKGHQLLDSQPNDLPACIALFETVLQNIDEIYNSLVTLDSKDISSTSINAITPPQEPISSLPPGLEAWHSRKHEQEQNAHGRSIVKRVQARLEGYVDSDSKQYFGYAEQSDYWIQQATRKKLLALMYEGWTAWV